MAFDLWEDRIGDRKADDPRLQAPDRGQQVWKTRTRVVHVDHYEIVPQHLAAEIIEAHKKELAEKEE